MQTPNPAIPDIQNTADVAAQLSFGPARPAVLFPVRLETRFFTLADGGSELRIRVYPDKVFVDSHEPALTAEEITWGKHFWEQSWRAATDEGRAKTAWQQLADRFDAPRAAWVALTLKPLNPLDRPDGPVTADAPWPTAPPQFPSPATKAEAWTRAPLTRVLPNQWIALGYKNGQLVVNAKGNLIPDSLPMGPDPGVTQGSAPPPPDQLGIDDGMKWMVDFDVAEQKGMGIRARLTAATAAAGLDFLIVLGIKDAPGGTTDWTPRLAELLNAHHYTDGLGFVRQGTPSNNTADAPSGFSSVDPGHEESYLAERAAPESQPGDRSNCDVLTTALGLADNRQVLHNLPNAGVKEQADARQMNTALWQATWGYFLSQMVGVPGTAESPLTDPDIAWVRKHFIDYVRANGPLPALRIGKQPYGVLPVTSLSAWSPPAGQSGLYSRDLALQQLLIDLRNVWRGNYPNVPRLGRTQDTVQQKGIDRDLAEVLSMDGLSSSYSIRNLLGRHYLEHLWVFLSAGYYMDVWEPLVEDFPPEPEQPEFEEPPEDLTPRQRTAWIRAQQQIQQQYQIAYNAWLGQMSAIQARYNYVAAKNAYTPSWWAAHDQRAKSLLESVGLLQKLGTAWRPRLARGMFSPHVVRLDGALVQPVRNAALSPNYIDTLLAARDLNNIRSQPAQQPPPASLLNLLLRHSMLQEYGDAASRLLALQPADRREPELVNMPGQVGSTIWERLDKPFSVGGVQMPLRNYLLGFRPDGEPDVAGKPELEPLSDFRASLAHLRALAPERLEELMTGTLDLCSHRLDAWITSFATKRLAEMRNTSRTGVLLGGYGWVMNLKPAAAQVKVVPTPAGEQDPVFQLTDNPGFVHAPSLTQASTVAVLRSGHLANAGDQSPNDVLSIDLSSERVRLATWLLDGVRQGQPLGALLGYRFERRLREGGKAKFISRFREVAPLVARKLEQTNQPSQTEAVEAIAANNVVDGLRLHTLWRETQTGDATQVQQKEQQFFQKISPVTTTEVTGLRPELNALADAADCVSDALMAESIHQVVSGNPLRTATTVESIAGGETPPPELEVVQTPRTGIALTHRVLTLFAGDPVLPQHWASPGIPFRADAEPHLNALVGRLLPNALNVRCVVDRLEPGSGRVLESKELRLNQLRLTPLDFIYAVDGQAGQHAEIEQRIMYGIMRKADGFAPGSLLRVNHGRRPGWAATDLSYGEFNELVKAARKLVGGARAIDAGDLDLPERSTEFSVDVAELESRVATAEVWLRRTPNDFKAVLAAGEAANLDALRDLILRSATFGVPGAVPLSAAGTSAEARQTLFRQGASIQKELTQRVEQLTALISGFNPVTATTEQRRDHAIARLRIVFGKAFVVLPRFTAANAAELAKALGDSLKVQGGDPFASTTWLQRMSRVRDAVGRLNASLNYSEAVNAGERLNLGVAQLPYGAADRWVGLPLQPGQQIPGGKLSLVVQAATPLDVRKPLAGLLIDEWVETVPSATETTGIALQYDRPNATPPQNILVAVPPVVEAPWTVWSLQQVLLETLDLARVRAVDPDALGDVGHYLPATYFAVNTEGDAITTDFTKIRF